LNVVVTLEVPPPQMASVQAFAIGERVQETFPERAERAAN
jgi:hypothetical protein